MVEGGVGPSQSGCAPRVASFRATARSDSLRRRFAWPGRLRVESRPLGSSTDGTWAITSGVSAARRARWSCQRGPARTRFRIPIGERICGTVHWCSARAAGYDGAFDARWAACCRIHLVRCGEGSPFRRSSAPTFPAAQAWACSTTRSLYAVVKRRRPPVRGLNSVSAAVVVGSPAGPPATAASMPRPLAATPFAFVSRSCAASLSASGSFK